MDEQRPRPKFDQAFLRRIAYGGWIVFLILGAALTIKAVDALPAGIFAFIALVVAAIMTVNGATIEE